MKYKQVAKCFKNLALFLRVLRKDLAWYMIYRDREVVNNDRYKLNRYFAKLMDRRASYTHPVDLLIRDRKKNV